MDNNQLKNNQQQQEQNTRRCSVCKVVIENEKIARYSFGKTNTLEHLEKKVCKYVKHDRPGCINLEIQKRE